MQSGSYNEDNAPQTCLRQIKSCRRATSNMTHPVDPCTINIISGEVFPAATAFLGDLKSLHTEAKVQ
jgi:hypothetical protein